MASGKKNARQQRAWIIFQDESGVSERPPVRRTWAPKGQTPVLTHPFNWSKISVAAFLAYRWDGRRCRLLFRIQEGSFNAERLIAFLRSLKHHFRGQKVILLWDRLPAHRARVMTAFLNRQPHWLRMKWLPSYAPELNPTEFLWGHAKGGELANQSVWHPLDVIEALRRELMRARCRGLGFSFLKHAGLSFV